MTPFQIVIEQTPVHIVHDTYKRECKYTRGIHIPFKDFVEILDRMCNDTRMYFDFHNTMKPIQVGTLLNGHSGLAKEITNYYKNKKQVDIPNIMDGKDFYVKIVE